MSDVRCPMCHRVIAFGTGTGMPKNERMDFEFRQACNVPTKIDRTQRMRYSFAHTCYWNNL